MKKKYLKYLLIGMASVFIFIIFSIIRWVMIDMYCSDMASNLPDSQRTIQYTENVDEVRQLNRNPTNKRQYGGISGAFREELKCERDQKIYYLF